MTDFRTIRQTLGLSQGGLALKLGLNQSTISRFETGDLQVDERTRLALDALVMQSRAKAPAERKKAA